MSVVRAADEKGAAVATLLTADGELFSRPVELPPFGEKIDWKIYNRGEAVKADQLYVGLPGAIIRSKRGHVNLLFGTDINHKSPYPIYEAAIIPHQDEDADLSFTLDRGRVVLTNLGLKGSATVKVKFRDEVWQFTLEKPLTRIGIETFGRWAAGTRFKPDPKSKDAPTQQTIVLVLHGDVTLKTATHRIAMSAPPGPAIYAWDSENGADRSARFLKERPDWAKVDLTSPQVKESIARFEKVRRMFVKDRDVLTTVRALLKSDDADLRQRAPIAAGAFDALGELAATLQSSKDPEVWHKSVVALRHWLGRAPGMDQRMYQAMTDKKNPLSMPPAHAQMIIQLLHGFSEDDRKRPELYDVLIQLLEHERLGIRGLAAWHLHHCAQCREIEFNPGGTEQERKKIVEAWRKHIPSGKLPSSPKIEEKQP